MLALRFCASESVRSRRDTSLAEVLVIVVLILVPMRNNSLILCQLYLNSILFCSMFHKLCCSLSNVKCELFNLWISKM